MKEKQDGFRPGIIFWRKVEALSHFLLRGWRGPGTDDLIGAKENSRLVD